MDKEAEKSGLERKKRKGLAISPLLWMQAVSRPGPCYASAEIASVLSFRKCVGMRRNERERKN